MYVQKKLENSVPKDKAREKFVKGAPNAGQESGRIIFEARIFAFKLDLLPDDCSEKPTFG
jgi:hypothetical protein